MPCTLRSLSSEQHWLLKTKRFCESRLSEQLWHLERRVMEQRVEGMEVADALTKTRSE